MLRNIKTTTAAERVGLAVVGESGPVHEPESEANGCLGVTRQCSKRVC